MARRRKSVGEEGFRLIAQIALVVIVFYAFLALVNSDAFKGATTQIAHNMFSGVGVGASPPPGTAWTAADGQACHGAFDAVSDWPGKSATTQMGAVMYSGSSDVQAARQAALAATTTYLAKSSTLSVPASAFEIGAFRASLSDLQAAAAQPMTVPDFRAKYQRTIDTLSGIRTRCTAIDQWVRDHVAQ
jgi:hypothetical protein